MSHAWIEIGRRTWLANDSLCIRKEKDEYVLEVLGPSPIEDGRPIAIFSALEQAQLTYLLIRDGYLR